VEDGREHRWVIGVIREPRADGVLERTLQRAGVATGGVSIPNRYMHSPNEVVALDDVDATIRLLAAFCRGLREGDDFIPI